MLYGGNCAGQKAGGRAEAPSYNSAGTAQSRDFCHWLLELKLASDSVDLRPALLEILP